MDSERDSRPPKQSGSRAKESSGGQQPRRTGLCNNHGSVLCSAACFAMICGAVSYENLKTRTADEHVIPDQGVRSGAFAGSKYSRASIAIGLAAL